VLGVFLGVGSARVSVVGWGDPEAFGAAISADEALVDLYREHGSWLVGLLTVFVGDRVTAEDIAQEAFLRVYRAWPRLRDEDRAVGYLRTTALNLARSGFRRRLVALRHGAKTERDAAAADEAVILRDEQRAVIAALRGLPTRQRECLVLRFYGELSEAEIASAIGISASSVKTHTRRGLAALEERLGELR
jgi:RNA polymerase sigma-70 factor (sigma-E family)